MSADLDARDRHGLPPRADTPQMSPLARELTRLRKLNDELLAALEAITSASDSDNAQGGEMWWSEAVYPHVEAAKAVIPKAKGAQ